MLSLLLFSFSAGPLCEVCVPNWTRNYFSPVSVCEACPSKLILAAIHIASLLGKHLSLLKRKFSSLSLCGMMFSHVRREEKERGRKENSLP